MLSRRSLGLVSLVFALLAVIPTATGRGTAGDTWAGSWSTEFGPLTLTQTGAKVEGSYTHDSGHVVGTVTGSVFTGRWDEAPTRSGPKDAGAVIFTLQSGGKSFTGRWSYDGDPTTFFTTWNGTCTSGSCVQNGAAAVATTFLHLQVIGADAVVNPSPAGTIYNADCPNNVCIFRYPVGTTVTLTPVSGPFAGWLGLYSNWPAPCLGKSPCTITMDREKAVKAVFSPLQLNLGWNRGGHIEVPGSSCGARCVLVPYGNTVKVAAVADPGYHLQAWRGICEGAKAQVLQPHDARQQIGVRELRLGRRDRHHPAARHDLRPVPRLGRGAGTVSGPKGLTCAPGCAQIDYERGRQIVLTATPTGAGRFVGWTGVCAGAGSTCVIRASAPPSGGYRAVAALFN